MVQFYISFHLTFTSYRCRRSRNDSHRQMNRLLLYFAKSTLGAAGSNKFRVTSSDIYRSSAYGINSLRFPLASTFAASLSRKRLRTVPVTYLYFPVHWHRGYRHQYRPRTYSTSLRPYGFREHFDSTVVSSAESGSESFWVKCTCTNWKMWGLMLVDFIIYWSVIQNLNPVT